MMKASGRAAVILLAGFFLAGLFVLFGGVAQAAPGSAASSKSDSAGKQADAVKPSKQQRRHTSRHRDSTKTAQKSDDKADKKDAAATADEAKADTREVPEPDAAGSCERQCAARGRRNTDSSCRFRNDGPRQRQRPGRGR